VGKKEEKMNHKIKYIAIAVIFLMYPSISNAYEFAEGWTTKDTMYQAVAIGLKAIDYGQTLHIAKNPKDHYEMNPFLSRHPSENEVHTYFIVGTLAQTMISLALPPKANVLGYEINPRRLWQYVQITGSGSCVLYNASVGIRIDF
jgi:hypothetical protein